MTEIEETYSTRGPECPYCHTIITPDDPIYYEANRLECDECGHEFDVEVDFETTWTCIPIAK